MLSAHTRKTLLFSLGLFLLAFIAIFVVFSTEPEAQREAATRKTAMLVDVVSAEAGDFQPVITAMGTVKASQHVQLRPRVSGQVVSMSAQFAPGSLVAAGTVLLEMDAADYQNALAQKQSELAQAEMALNVEMGEQELALRDYQRLNQNLSAMQKSLVLREPQLKAARARVAAAEAAVQQAELELARTKVRAPFDAQILTRQVNVGSQLNTSDVLAELVGMNHYWVEATLPLNKVSRLKQGEAVTVIDRSAWKAGDQREGKVLSVIGELQGESRMARVLIDIEDPLAIGEQNKNKPTLMVGSFVECQIRAEPLENVVKLPRDLLRKRDTAWVMEDNSLSIRELDIEFMDKDFAYISAGLSAGENIVVTDLSRIRDGAELRLKSE